MQPVVDIGGVIIFTGQIQYVRLTEKGERLTLYFAGRTLTLDGREKDQVLEAIELDRIPPSKRTTALLPHPTSNNRGGWEDVKRSARRPK